MDIIYLIDFPTPSVADSKSIGMSRKRTRSRSEDNIFGEGMKIQPIMVWFFFYLYSAYQGITDSNKVFLKIS